MRQRVVVDPVPLLEKAKQVRIAIMTNRKIIDSERSSEELARDQSRHGIDVIIDKMNSAGRTIGDALAREVASYNADLPVTGAYGHLGLRESIRGGAAKNILSKPLLLTLFSH